MNTILDPAIYLRTPRLGVATGLSLGKMLLTVVPPRAGPGVKRAARSLHGSLVELEQRWKSQVQPRRVIDARPFDHRIDRAWSVTHTRLQQFDIFPPDDEDRLRAEELLGLLFPNGLDFIVQPYLAEHAESSRRIDAIRGDADVQADLDRLVGDLFVSELFEAHDAYGEALGITTAAPATAEVVTVVEPMRAVTQAIVAYTLQVLAWAELDRANGPAAVRALEPIDKFRRAASRRGASGGEVEPEEVIAGEAIDLPADAPSPDAPIPDVPAGDEA